MMKSVIVMSAGMVLMSAMSDSLVTPVAPMPEKTAPVVSAQPVDQEPMTEVVVEARQSFVKTFPSSSQAIRVYPERAKDRRVSGQAQIACTWSEAGRLKCIVEREAPEGYGFGAATVSLFETYARMDMKRTNFVPEEGKWGKHFRYYWGTRQGE